MCALNAASLKRLPLIAEPIELWSKSTDLYSFLSDLFDDDAEGVDESGVRFSVNYKDYGVTLFDRGKSSFQAIAAEFQIVSESNRAEPSPFDDPIQIDTPPNFLKDESFGLMAKHAISLAAVLEWLLSDSQFFPLPHTLEAGEELDCSVLLAKNLYYKQSLQMLRSLLELNVLHIHFVGDQVAYTKWQNGQGDRLQLRGKGKLLQKLQENGAVDQNLGRAVDDLYAELNGNIHSAEAKMIHRGLRDREWAGLQFKTADFRAWCTYVSRAVTVSVSLLSAMRQQMRLQPADNGIVCDVCRAINSFLVEERGDDLVTLRCFRCGHQCSFDAEYAAKFGYS
jgi:hypothetical protein